MSKFDDKAREKKVERMKWNVLYLNSLWLKTYLNDLTCSIEF